jgi:hypothetical protein
LPRLSICIEQLSSHQTDFHEIWYLSIFRKSVKKIQVSLKCDKAVSCWILLGIWNVSD